MPEQTSILFIAVKISLPAPTTTSSTTTTPTSTSTVSSSSSTSSSSTISTPSSTSTTTISTTITTISTSPTPLTSSTTSPIPTSDCRLVFEKFVYKFNISEGSKNSQEWYSCGKVKSVLDGTDCPENIEHNYMIDNVETNFLSDFTMLNSSSGDLTCRDIYSSSDKDYPESITVIIQDSIFELAAETVALFAIQESNNHMPKFDSMSSTVIGFPDFIFLESPVSIPIAQFHAYDNDRNDEINFTISDEANYFTIDKMTGNVYYTNDKYLSVQASATISVKDKAGHEASLDVTFVPIKEKHVIPLKVIVFFLEFFKCTKN